MGITNKLIAWFLKRKWKEIQKMAEKDQKPWYLSKTVIAGIITAVIGITSAFGVGIEAEKDAIIDFVLQLATAIAGVVAIYGRMTATKKITK